MRLPLPQLLAAVTVVWYSSAAEGLDNGVGLRPPMGWRSWNMALISRNYSIIYFGMPRAFALATSPWVGKFSR
eukprot:COSAG06_NODE_6849_length_2747_cov_1.628021_1_plen_72_part_10